MIDATFIGVISAKGGVGKTTTAINLGAALNEFGRQVVVVDGNYTKPNVGVMLGITKVNATLHHTLRGQEHIKNSIYVHPCGLHVVPGSIIYEDLHGSMTQKLHEVLSYLKGKAEAVLVDCGPGFSTEVSDVLDLVEVAMLVTTPDLASLTDTLKSKKFCEDKGVKVLGVVVTHNILGDHVMNLSDIESVLGVPVIGNIPYDVTVRHSQYKKYPVIFSHPDSLATIAYKKLAANLIGSSYEPDVEDTLLEYVLKRIGLR